MAIPFPVMLGLRAERAENDGDADAFHQAGTRILDLEAENAQLRARIAELEEQAAEQFSNGFVAAELKNAVLPDEVARMVDELIEVSDGIKADHLMHTGRDLPIAENVAQRAADLLTRLSRPTVPTEQDVLRFDMKNARAVHRRFAAHGFKMYNASDPMKAICVDEIFGAALDEVDRLSRLSRPTVPTDQDVECVAKVLFERRYYWLTWDSSEPGTEGLRQNFRRDARVALTAYLSRAPERMDDA